MGRNTWAASAGRASRCVPGWLMAGSVPGGAFITEPVIATGPVRGLADRLALPVRRHRHSVDLGVRNRLALDPYLVALPCLGLGHHLSDQIPTQPHLTRLAPTAAGTTRWPAWRLVHERPADPARRQPVLPGGFNRPAAGGGRQLIASTARPGSESMKLVSGGSRSKPELPDPAAGVPGAASLPVSASPLAAVLAGSGTRVAVAPI